VLKCSVAVTGTGSSASPAASAMPDRNELPVASLSAPAAPLSAAPHDMSIGATPVSAAAAAWERDRVRVRERERDRVRVRVGARQSEGASGSERERETE
jgi:hypothetical protein